MERNYIVICNRYKGIAGSLLFWGNYTEDNEKRNFGGYTSDFNCCEKYSKEELLHSGYKFKDYNGSKEDWKKFDDFIIHINQLGELGYRPMLIYYR